MCTYVINKHYVQRVYTLYPRPTHTHTHAHSLHSRDGIDFLSNLPGLKSCCFVAMEAVSWVFEKISGVQSRGEAVKLLQVTLH